MTGRPSRAAFFWEGGMELYYEGVDITEDVDVKACVHRDHAGGRCDGLILELESAARWYAWGPKKDDRIEVRHGGYTTGRLYLHSFMPEDGVFRILAMSMPGGSYRKAWGSFEKTTLAGVMRASAAECGMDWRLYGLDANALYPYLTRKNESCPAFLDRLMRLEGSALKCYDGQMVGISIEYAQRLDAAVSVDILADQPGVTHRLSDGKRLLGIEIRTPYASAVATDTAALDATDRPVYAELPVLDGVHAGRWARGMLLCHNRLAEELVIETVFNPAMTAMARVDVSSATGAAGEWLVHEAEHDFVNMKTTARMHRCITSIR